MATTCVENVTVQWKGHDQFLAEGIRNFFQQTCLVDANVSYHGECIQVHRLILAIFLPTFKHTVDITMSCSANGDDAQNAVKELNLNFVASRFHDVRALVEFVYTGKVTVAEDRLYYLKRLADDLSFDGLSRAIEDLRGTVLRERQDDYDYDSHAVSLADVEQVHVDCDVSDSWNCLRAASADVDQEMEELCGDAETDAMVELEQKNEVDIGPDTTPTNDLASPPVTLCSLSLPALYAQPAYSAPSGSAPPLILDATVRRRRTCPLMRCPVCIFLTSDSELYLNHMDQHKQGGGSSTERLATTTTQQQEEEVRILKCPFPSCRFLTCDKTLFMNHMSQHSSRESKRLDGLLASIPNRRRSSRNDGSGGYKVSLFGRKTAVVSVAAKTKAQNRVGAADRNGETANSERQAAAASGDTQKETSKSATMNNDHKYFGETSTTCDACNKTFKTVHSLRGHRKVCGQADFACKQCDHVACDRDAWKAHLADVHHVDAKGKSLAKDVKCSQCAYTCNEQYKLRSHFRRMHSDDKPFKCRECEYSAVIKRELEQHVSAAHRNERNFMCDVCGARFHTKYKMNVHVLWKHKGVKPYKCKLCGVEYSCSGNYRVHMQKHQSEVKPHVCHVCGHGCNKRWHLRGHMRKHGIELESLKKVYAPRSSEQQADFAAESAQQQQQQPDILKVVAELLDDGEGLVL